MIEWIYWAAGFQSNEKMDFREILEGHEKIWKVSLKNLLDEHDHFSINPIYIRFTLC